MSTPSRNNRNIASSSSTPSVANNFSAPPPSPIILPPGYKFLPSDEVLILHYLKPFLQGTVRSFPNIHRVNIYESDPEQLSTFYKKGNDKEWFFITERTKKSEGGKQQSRGDNGGRWRPLKAAKKIEAGDGVVGYRTKLEYYIGKEANSEKGDWLMHEYWFDSNGDNKKVDYALCKIYLTPKEAKSRAEEEDDDPLSDFDPNVAFRQRSD